MRVVKNHKLCFAWIVFLADMIRQEYWEGAIRASDCGLYRFMLESPEYETCAFATC
jgi:hypothetical protein